MKPHFELRRIRDFGEVISDSFVFFTDNFKTLFKPLLIICGFFMALSVIGHVIMQTGMLNLTNGRGAPNPAQINNSVFDMYKGMGYYYAGFLPFMLSIYLVTYSYIAISLEKKDGERPSLEEVWGYFKYYFFRALGSSIVIFIVMMVGFVLCLLPGIYLGVVLSLALPIIVFENASFGYAFNKSFKLIGGNWWFTFGIQIIMIIIVSFSSSIAGLPISAITVLNVFIGLGELAMPLVVFFSTLLHLIMLAGYALIAVSVALCYFSYSEQKEGTGLMGRINQLGQNNDDNTHLPTEQY